MNDELIPLVLNRCCELGQMALSAHTECLKWREFPLTSSEQTEYSVKLNNALAEQRKWLKSLENPLQRQ